MKKIIKAILYKILRPFLVTAQQRHEEMIRILSDNNFRTRAMMNRAQSKPIQVLFVCHEPTMWCMFDSVYRAMLQDPVFAPPLVVALPYKHLTIPYGQYKDAGMFDFCKTKGLHAVHGYDKEKAEWLNPISLKPDYVFFQQPYPALLNQVWSVEKVAMMARVCYIPYATLLAKGEVAAVLHPESFFQHVSLFFTENLMKMKWFEEEFKDKDWYDKKKVVSSGYPKFDYLTDENKFYGKVWKRGMRNNIKRILWTPRWRTSERTCHFFDYKEYFIEFCRKHDNVDFVFRPHPYCLDNFLQTGEMSLNEQKKMKQDYEMSINMAIDANANYEDTFMTSDILISDFSSMLIEYFATGKPIIYTHRKDIFNDYGRLLSSGLYWVRNRKELNETFLMLLSGKDSLHKKREELMKTLFFMPEGGAGRVIKEHIKADYRNC